MFYFLSSGGLDDRGAVSLAIQTQVEQAMRSADVILFLLDSKVGVTSVDSHFATWLRKQLKAPPSEYPTTIATGSDARVLSAKDIILVANKTEGAHLSDRVLDTVAEGMRCEL